MLVTFGYAHILCACVTIALRSGVHAMCCAWRCSRGLCIANSIVTSPWYGPAGLQVYPALTLWHPVTCHVVTLALCFCLAMEGTCGAVYQA
jgi:hypothetical protein